MKRKFWTVVAIVLTIGALGIAHQFEMNEVKAAPAITVPETKDDPEYGKVMGQMPEDDKLGLHSYIMGSSATASSYTGKTYTHNSKFDGITVVNGIDVSYYQGTVDWNKVKADGIDFVFVRVGYRGSEQGTLQEDTKYKTNIQGALNAGLDVGVYFYSQAITEAEAVEEANYVLSKISSYNITMPVVIDYEYAYSNGQNAGRLWNAKLSKEQATTVCRKFCQTVKNAGYEPAVYANKSMLTDSLNAGALSSEYSIWLAHYTTQSSYTGDYTYWQYSDSGRVYGITGTVDCDFFYNSRYQSGGIDYSPVFDPEYYLNKYSDLKAAFGDNQKEAFEHFLNCGMKEGRQAKATFDVNSYRRQYADLRQAFGNDLKSYYLHYIEFGQKEGRQTTGCTSLQGAITVYNGVNYGAVYNYDYYINQYADIKKAYGEDDYAVLKHFVECGMKEGRQAKATFDVNSYRRQYADLRQAFGNDLKSYYRHYIEFGQKEGRQTTGCTSLQGAIAVYNGVNYGAIYNYDYYINQYADIKKAYGEDDYAVLKHFVEFGMKEGRQAKATFDVNSYRRQYADLRQAFGNDLKSYYLHYIEFGQKEGRQTTGCTSLQGAITVYNGVNYGAVYNYDYYINQYADIKKAYGEDDYAVLKHFVEFGMKEGRQAKETFSVRNYQSNYIDLQNAFGDDLIKYYLHYIEFGEKEGRKAS